MTTQTQKPAANGAAPQDQRLANRDPRVQKQQGLAQLIASRKDAFALVAGKHFNTDRLVKLAQGALARTPDIANCTPGSVLVALMRCAELELEPDSALPQRRMWLVPRWNEKLHGKECTYVIDYRAQIQKARETGLVKSIIASEVRKNDRFSITYSADGESIAKFEFAPGGQGGVFADRGDVIGYFAVARLEGGEVQVAFMSKKEAEAFRDRRAPKKKDGSAAFSPWVSDFDAMAIKTCLRKLWNLLPAGATEAARKLQEIAAGETEIEVGKSVQSTAPVELDLGVPEDAETETTDAAVERALGAGEQSASPAATPAAAAPQQSAPAPQSTPAPARSSAKPPPPPPPSAGPDEERSPFDE